MRTSASNPRAWFAGVDVDQLAAPETRSRELLGPFFSASADAIRLALAGEPAKTLDPHLAGHAADALEEWKASQRMDLDRPEARLNLGVLAAELGDLEEAEAQTEAARRLAPRVPTVYVNLADIHRAAGREEQSRAILREGLKIAPDNAALWHALGLALVREHRPAEALDALKKAAQLDPANARFAEVYRIAQSELAAPPR